MQDRPHTHGEVGKVFEGRTYLMKIRFLNA